MKHAARGITVIIISLLSVPLAPRLHAQELRGGGVRVGEWNVDVAPWITRSPHFEVFLQRGIGGDVALENSLGVWRIVVNQTKAYIIPLFTSLKFYPLDHSHRVQPFAAAGVGFGFGVQDQDDNAVGGANSTLVTGIAARAAAGIEVRIAGGFAVSAAGKYQWVHFGEDVGTMETFGGVGWEGGVIYRVPF